MKSIVINTAIIFVAYSFCSCNSSSTKKTGNAPISLQDTFTGRDDYGRTRGELKSLKGFVFDTISLFQKKTMGEEYLIIPRLIDKKDSVMEIDLRREIFSKKKSFLNLHSDLIVDENSKKIKGWRIDFWPSNIYKNNKLISYCFQICYSDTVLMRPYCNYKCINYDIQKAEFIKFSNFFEIHSREDSLYLKRLILTAVNEESAMSQLSLDDDLTFSMDEDHVFFYFDQYELDAPFNIAGGIKKKYLDKFIKDEYK